MLIICHRHTHHILTNTYKYRVIHSVVNVCIDVCMENDFSSLSLNVILLLLVVLLLFSFLLCIFFVFNLCGLSILLMVLVDDSQCTHTHPSVAYVYICEPFMEQTNHISYYVDTSKD